MRGHQLFLREFARRFHTTGAILPSGRYLARELARYVSAPPVSTASAATGRRLLEVGPGTGPVTDILVRRLAPNDTLDLVELNEAFVENLQEQLRTRPHWQKVNSQVRIHQLPIQEFTAEPFDAIISGLPLNNFPVPLVESILEHLQTLLAPAATLSFFEYIAIREMKTMVSSRQERQRLREIGAVLTRFLDSRRIACKAIWLNVPPAKVHHVRQV